MMAGRLIVMDAEFFEDFIANTRDMQFSGDNREAETRLRKLAENAFPQTWSELLRWPAQCECGHTMEFAVLYYVVRMHCPICRKPIGTADLHARLLGQSSDRDRYHMLVASMDDDVFTFGEDEARALRAMSCLTDDGDLLADTASDLNVGTKYRRQGD